MSLLLLNQNSQLNRQQLAKKAGAVLYLDARKATKYGLPTNSPLTNPWSDLSGNGNDGTPANFAGTTSSGVDVSDPLRPFWVFDGADDNFSFVNTPSVDVLNAPLAVFTTIKVSVGSSSRYVICKNLDSASNLQYAILFDSGSITVANSVKCYARSTGTNSAENSVMPGQWVNVGFIWDGANVQPYVNGKPSGSPLAVTGTLTSRPNLRIGRRETAASHFIGDIATATVYSGDKATISNILKSERMISNPYVVW